MKKVIIFLFILSISSLTYASNRATPVSEAVKKIQDSVVNIRTEKIVSQSPFRDPFFDDFFGFTNTYRTQSLGSGVIISPEGIIITNHHVVEAASKIFVILTDNRQMEAETLGTDPTLDIAVIKIKGNISGLKPATLGTSSDIMLGETVIAMGNPYGLNSSVTTGVVSNVRRVVGDENGFSIFIQTDALINPGNSGGPLINIDGEVIGINTAIYKEAQGIGFSIPIDTVNRAAIEFLNYGKIRKGYPGFTVNENQTASATNLYITEITKGGSADKAGVKAGDRLLQLDAIPVNTFAAFKYIIKTFPAGQSLPAMIERNGKIFNITLKMTEMPETYGLSILKARYGVTFEETKNYIIVNSSSSEKYIRRGDILLAVNNMELMSSKQLAEILNEAEGTAPTFTFARNNQVFNIQLRL